MPPSIFSTPCLDISCSAKSTRKRSKTSFNVWTYKRLEEKKKPSEMTFWHFICWYQSHCWHKITPRFWQQTWITGFWGIYWMSWLSMCHAMLKVLSSTTKPSNRAVNISFSSISQQPQQVKSAWKSIQNPFNVCNAGVQLAGFRSDDSYS